MVPGAELRLLDLPPDLLARIGSQLPFEERLQLSLVCRRWWDVCAGPSQLWSIVDATIRHGVSAHTTERTFNPCIPAFVRWFTKRAQAVEQLQLQVVKPDTAPDMLLAGYRYLPVPAGLLHDGSRPLLPLPLRKLAFSYHGGAYLDFSVGRADPADWLPALQKVALFEPELLAAPENRERWATQAPPTLTDLSVIGGLPDAFEGPNGWLPTSLTALVVSAGFLGELPPALANLKHLRSLVLDDTALGHGLVERHGEGLPLLAQLGQLEELNLSANRLGCPPPQITALRRLRILYLHDISWGADELPPPEAWEPLRACTALAFLSISRNGLERLPPAVADMAHLQGLHCEENGLPSLPAAPYLSNLRELLVDWRTLMADPTFLRGAKQLARLILHRFQPVVPPAGGGGPLGPPAGAGEALLAELAAMPSLQRVDDVFEEGASTHLVTADMAHVMWQLGKRCPHLEFSQPRSTNLGWTLSSLVAELPHNAGTAVLGQ